MRVLTDREVKQLVAEGKLFNPSTFSEAQCKGVFYDLRVAPGKYYSTTRSHWNELSRFDPLVMNPGECVWVTTIEELNFVSGEHCALIFAVVSLLQVGVSHDATSVDPGFNKHLAITLINHGSKPISIYPGRTVCKMLILELSSPPERLWLADSWWDSFPEAALPPVLDTPWHPVAHPTVEHLERLPAAYGPPYDVIAPLIAEAHQRANAALVPRQEIEEARLRLTAIEQRLALNEQHLQSIVRHDTGIAALEAKFANLEGQFTERNRKQSWATNRKWIIISAVIGILGVLVGAWLQR